MVLIISTIIYNGTNNTISNTIITTIIVFNLGREDGGETLGS